MDTNSNGPFLRKYLARIVCTIAAFVLALLLVTIGAVKTVIVIAIAIGGFFLGRLLDDKERLRRIIDTYLGRS